MIWQSLLDHSVDLFDTEKDAVGTSSGVTPLMITDPCLIGTRWLVIKGATFNPRENIT
jgi:hypothetical protein